MLVAVMKRQRHVNTMRYNKKMQVGLRLIFLLYLIVLSCLYFFITETGIRGETYVVLYIWIDLFFYSI